MAVAARSSVTYPVIWRCGVYEDGDVSAGDAHLQISTYVILLAVAVVFLINHPGSGRCFWRSMKKNMTLDESYRLVTTVLVVNSYL